MTEKKKTRLDTNVGRSLDAHLTTSGQTQADLAKTLDVTPSYLSQVTTGRRTASPEWLNVVATAMNLSPEDTAKLHVAGALDAGYAIDLDLTTPFNAAEKKE
jgi:DNA-binding transcriptional regulator YdaS (Cro superfamily)